MTASRGVLFVVATLPAAHERASLESPTEW